MGILGEEIEFTPYSEHGVRLGHNGLFLQVFDTMGQDTIVGHTKIDRYPFLVRRIADICQFLRQEKGNPVDILFAPCSVGYEPLSFARELFSRKQLDPDSIKISALDKNEKFIKCAKTFAIPEISIRELDWNWAPYIEYNENDDLWRFKPSLTDHVHIENAQDFLEYHKNQDIIVMMNLLYHLKEEETEQKRIVRKILSKAFDTVAYGFIADIPSYRACKNEFDTCANEKGFINLKGQFEGIDPTFAKWMNDRLHIVFIRKDYAEKIAQIVQGNAFQERQQLYGKQQTAIPSYY